MTAKWTLGELKQIVRNNDKPLMKEVLEYLIERGPSVVNWESREEMCIYCSAMYTPPSEGAAKSDICDACDAKSKSRTCANCTATASAGETLCPACEASQ